MADAGPALRLQRVGLTDFRNYDDLLWQPAGRIAAIIGPNGAGKTNLLEAISLLVPGRGLRGARMPELLRHGAARWAVAARFETPAGEMDVGTGTPPDGTTERRVFRVNGAPPRSQADVAQRVAAVWLTPQMDRLFQEAAGGRRRFLDRLVWALEPGHAREIAAHDNAMAQRNRLLAEGRAQDAWLAGLEDAMARHGVAAAAARRALVARLNALPPPGAFPAVRVLLKDAIADWLEEAPALAAEDRLRAALAANRGRDAAAGSSLLGAHRADMDLLHLEKNLPAALASTGEQKALLVSTILGHTALIAEVRGFAPLLLLDEPAVHLDPERRAALFAALVALPAQVLMTGTDADIFAPLSGLIDMQRADGGKLSPEPGFPRENTP